ncbi:regucalcin-like [Gigantopelta aegis]|uniref:regucalcin-like n=1 Tax=Gigantopelta aegis TaxID=1735272 RepID=UPI001B887E07|nr:regucalcin-like [Gigantopelta aegis]
MSYTVEPVIKNSCSSIGEGPHWDAASQSLFYVDIKRGDVHKWNSLTKEDSKMHFDYPTVSIIVPCAEGGYVIGTTHSLSHLETWGSEKLTVWAEMEQGMPTQINDGKCDARGRLWSGTMGKELSPGIVAPELGALYSLDTKRILKKHVDKINISNGMDWTSDNKTMFFIDSTVRKVYAFDYDLESGSLSNQRTAVDFGEGTEPQLGLPDGMTMDTENKIWIACYNAGKVVCFDSETGKLLREVKIPASRTTSVAWGGANLDDLYVTSCRHGFSEEQLQTTEALSGSVFKITGLGAKGRQANNFQG